MKKSWGIKLLSCFFALGFAFLIVLFGAVVAPPRYTAQSMLAIDWSLLPICLSDLSKEEVPKIRSETLASLRHVDLNQFASQFCFRNGMPNASTSLSAAESKRDVE